MREKFFQFYPLADSEIKRLWDDSIFIFDTNVLFNLYRYSVETSNEFLDTMFKLKERSWLPYQVAYEFHKRRLSVIDNEIITYKEFNKKVEDIYADLENKNRNPFLSADLSNQFYEMKLKIGEEMNSRIRDYELRYNADNILERLIEIFSFNIGNEITIEKLNIIYKDGEFRFKEDIPPGFGDKKKPVPDRYGDLLIWYEIIQKAQEQKKSILFITDDGKEDWWLIHSRKTISPRPELLKEFKTKTGQLCHFYKPFQFLKYSNIYLGSQINLEVIKEVEQLEKVRDNISENISIKLKLRCVRDKSDLMRLVDSIINDGYDISLVNELSENVYSVEVTLPGIVDLERRFTKKYLSALHLYNIELVDYSKQ